MKVFIDYHHGNLFHSLHLLFEKRLGWEVYRPIGIEWLLHDYFKVAEPYGNPKETVDQYLSINHKEWDALKALNGGNYEKNGIYYVFDYENRIEHKAITFNKFKEMEFDYIVSTHPLHTNWDKLLQYQPKAKYISQIGNEGQTSDAQNILCSTADFKPQEHQKIIRYHQEFDLSEYAYSPPTNHNIIKSFVISLPEPELYNQYKNALPEFDFKAHGVGSPDGTVHGGLIPEMMKDSSFGYHVKPADGYGHVIHKWASVGRPIITRRSYYSGKMAEPLLIDGVTCIDLDSHSFEENLRIIRYWSDPKNHLKMCENVISNFRDVANFDREAEAIKDWLKII